MRRLTLGLALSAALVWCCLLFGIGLDDLLNDQTKPGVIFSLVVLPVMIGTIAYGAWRLARPVVRSLRASRR